MGREKCSMTNETAPKTLNWVRARAECSIDHLFSVLMAVVEADVHVAQERSHSSISFEFQHITEHSFMVTRKRVLSGILESEGVLFTRLPAAIKAQHRTPQQQTDLFTASPHMTAAGDCKFEVERNVLEPWQVSQRALDQLFFQYGLLAKGSE
jgi:hypothetical protein